MSDVLQCKTKISLWLFSFLLLIGDFDWLAWGTQGLECGTGKELFSVKRENLIRIFYSKREGKITDMEEVQDLLNKKHKRTSNMSKRILRQQAQSIEKESARSMPMTPLQGSTETEWK